MSHGHWIPTVSGYNPEENKRREPHKRVHTLYSARANQLGAWRPNFGNCEPTFGNLHNRLDTANGPRGDLRGSSEPSFSAITPESSLRSSRIEEVQIDGGFEGSSAISFMEDSVSSLAKEAALRNSRIEIVQIDEKHSLSSQYDPIHIFPTCMSNY